MSKKIGFSMNRPDDGDDKISPDGDGMSMSRAYEAINQFLESMEPSSSQPTFVGDAEMYPLLVEIITNPNGQEYRVTTPDFPKIDLKAVSLSQATTNAKHEIENIMIESVAISQPSDPLQWQNGIDQKVVYVEVDLAKVKRDISRTVHRTISIPAYLNERAKREDVNVSQILTDALKLEFGMAKNDKTPVLSAIKGLQRAKRSENIKTQTIKLPAADLETLHALITDNYQQTDLNMQDLVSDIFTAGLRVFFKELEETEQDFDPATDWAATDIG